MDENQLQKRPKVDWANVFPKFVIGLFLFLLGLWIGRTVSLPFLPAEQNKINILNKFYQRDNVDFTTFWKTWDLLQETYLEKKQLEPQKLLQGAISGLVEAVGDPYTSYFDPEANKTFNEVLSGQFEGVGMELGVKEGKLVVIAPLEGSPADKAGILAGDQLIAIDDKDATTYSIGEAVKLVRGKAGSKIKLSIKREGKSEILEFNLTREKIVINTVRLSFVEDAAVISVNRFGEDTNKEWDKAVNEVITKGSSKILIDVRNNPGGLLTSAIYISNEFLPASTTVVVEEDSNGKRLTLSTTREGKLQGKETVILINKGSASASEIFAGALQDLGKAEIVGEQSFGKGVVQKVTNYTDGSGVHVTIAKWLTPKGTWVHNKGVKPDFEVKMSEADFSSGKDPQKERALEILK